LLKLKNLKRNILGKVFEKWLKKIVTGANNEPLNESMKRFALNMLILLVAVQVCDATMLNTITKAGTIKIFSYIKLL
jgi:hypothetical protein